LPDVGQLHTQYVDRAYERTGTLWQGRFRSCVVQSENYLLNCHRYIELNPVRAGLVGHPREYCWSSYRANAEGDALPVLTPHPEYLRLGSAPFERQGAYRGQGNPGRPLKKEQGDAQLPLAGTEKRGLSLI